MSEKKRRRQLAYDYILKEIFENRLTPGTPIVEETLVDVLNISRTPIREAISMLEVEGIVECFPFRGTFVVRLTPADVEEIFNLRILLETYALRKGFDKIDTAALDRIEKLFNELADGGAWSEQHDADMQLHSLIVNSASSTRLRSMLSMINTQVGYLRRLASNAPQRKRDSLKEHLEIIKMIQSSDVNAAEESLRTHLLAVKQSILDAVTLL